MKVFAVKTIAGEEIIGNDIFISDGVVTMKDTVVLRGVQDPKTGEVIAGFGDWPAVGLVGQSYRIPLTALVLMPYQVHEDLERQYISNVTGMTLPPVTPKILLS